MASTAGFESAAYTRRKSLAGDLGPLALLKNLKVFGIACFACLGGLLYGYNQGVFSGILTMPAFKHRKRFLSTFTISLASNTHQTWEFGLLTRQSLAG